MATGVLFFVLMAFAMLPAVFWAGAPIKLPAHSFAATSMREVLMSGAYFVCELNLKFLNTHLPAYRNLRSKTRGLARKPSL